MNHSLIAVAVRLFALYLLWNALVHLSFNLVYFEPHAEFISFLTALLLLVALPAIAALLLWKYPLFVARHLLPEETDTQTPAGISETDAFRVGASILGLYLIATSLAGNANWLVNYLYLRSMPEPESIEISRGIWATLVGNSIETLFGLLLVLGSGTLVRIYTTLKYAGTTKSVVTQADQESN